jgi:hypothetical protein
MELFQFTDLSNNEIQGAANLLALLPTIEFDLQIPDTDEIS